MVYGMLFYLVYMFLGVGPTGGNDALDVVPTTAYWEAKQVTVSLEQLEQDAGADKAPGDVNKLIDALGSDDFKTRTEAKKALEAMGPAILPQLKPVADSKDPEVAAVAATLIKEFSGHGCARSVRRLMAIRTLGERKEKAAEEMLKGMLDSKEPFVGDYAARAVAQIEGKPYVPADHKAEVAKDLMLVPKGTGIVAQATGMPPSGLMLDKVAALAMDPENQNPMLAQFMPKNMDKKKLLTKLTGKLLDLVERVGDVRMDGVTAGISENVEGPGSWSVVAVRGKFDRAAMVAGIVSSGGDRMKATKQGDVDIIDTGMEMSVVIPSNELVVLILGGDKVDKAAMIEKVLAAIKTGKGEFEENKELAALVKTVDKTGPAWGAALLNADMRKIEPFAACASITLTGKMNQGALDFTFAARGEDADKMKASAETMTTNIQATLAMMKGQAAQMKSMLGPIAMLESIKVAADGKSGTMTGEIKSSMADSIGMEAATGIMFEEAMSERAADAAAGTQEGP